MELNIVGNLHNKRIQHSVLFMYSYIIEQILHPSSERTPEEKIGE